jgi:2-oxoglutarate dehydrogenase E1 component
MTIPETLNLDYIEQKYQQWIENPESVSEEWRAFLREFEGADQEGATERPPAVKAKAKPEPKKAPHAEVMPEPAPGEAIPGDACTLDRVLQQSRVEALKYRYRDIGHLLACLDPLAACPTSHPLLDLSAFNLSSEDLETEFYTRRLSESRSTPLKEIISFLRETYCQAVGVEYMHLQDPQERRWLQDRMEPVRNQPELTPEERVRILHKLSQATLFETYLNKKYMGQTRFSLEGGESLIPMLDTLLLHASANGCREVILGMAHRGRINVQSNILFKPYEEIFREFANTYDPESLFGSGDVKYHNGYLTDIKLANDRELRVFLVNNPSHLESVDPVVEGVAYARQDILKGEDRNQVLPLLIHGDAAFAGQGVVMETLQLSQLEGYGARGTLHIIINNQIGYTTLPEHARSTRYSTDVAKLLMVPIFHVHGENPEAVVHIIRLACDYRKTFGKDVVIDLICYRRYGHNEGDEPYFTQPLMYERIKKRPPIYKTYGEKLVENGDTTEEDIQQIESEVNRCLDDAFQAAQNNPRSFPELQFYENWNGYETGYSHEPIDTGVDAERLTGLSRKLNAFPKEFKPHTKIKRLLKARREAVDKGESIDWANAEALALATLLNDGYFVRLSGQDSARGTFSQRHSVLMNTKTGDEYVPLQTVSENGGGFSVLNSPLSETGVLGFEYGYSLVRPEGLTIWEAQFGDFCNNAQSVIDLYIAAGETKWQRMSGLVLLLPHGWEGLGPEHSSARLERFLQLCADDNMQVCNMTTPAQYFHLLRRQVLSRYRKPLVVMAPKSLLRHPQGVSELTDLTAGSFQPVLDDGAEIEKPRRVVFCSGKIYYQLLQRRDTLKSAIVIIRVEQLYPFPGEALAHLIEKYRMSEEWYWVQEEPENMGPWAFIRPRLTELIGKEPTYVGRRPSASPATGFANIYKQQQGAIPDEAIGQESGVSTG